MWQVIHLETVIEQSCENGLWQGAPVEVSLLPTQSEAQMELAEAHKTETSRKYHMKFLISNFMQHFLVGVKKFYQVLLSLGCC